MTEPVRPASPPAKPRRSRGKRVARLLSWVAVVTSVSVLVAGAIGFGALTLINSHVHRTCVLDCGSKKNGSTGKHLADKAAGKALNFLLVGSDSREGATPAELKQFSTEADPGKRTDTIILVHLSPKRDKAVLVSFPRDTWVSIPGHGQDRINTAYVNGELDHKGGGPGLLIQTVEQLTGVFIDHYLEVDFRGFVKMVNALGGVDVCLPTAVKDHFSGVDLPAGKSHIKGTMALSFVRQRHGLPDSDFGRIRHQQQFLGAMLRRATSLGILARPDRLYRFLDTVARSLTVDDKLSLGDMKNLAFKLRTLDPAKIVFITAPTKSPGVRREGKAVLDPDLAGYAALFSAIRADDAIAVGATPAPTVPPADLIVPPSHIRLRVLNGTGVNGAARRAADDLARVGFVIRATGPADATTYAKTIVRYGPAKADSARTVAAAIPGSSLQLDQTLGSTLEVVVGTNYGGARTVAISASPAPATGGTPTPSPVKTSTAADEPAGC